MKWGWSFAKPKNEPQIMTTNVRVFRILSFILRLKNASNTMFVIDNNLALMIYDEYTFKAFVNTSFKTVENWTRFHTKICPWSFALLHLRS